MVVVGILFWFSNMDLKICTAYVVSSGLLCGERVWELCFDRREGVYDVAELCAQVDACAEEHIAGDSGEGVEMKVCGHVSGTPILCMF